MNFAWSEDRIKTLMMERDKLAAALFEVIDGVCGGLDRPWDLQGYGIEPKRAEEICELAKIGRST